MHKRRLMTLVYSALILAPIALVVSAIHIGAQEPRGNGQLKLKDKEE